MSELVIKDVCYPRSYIDKNGDDKTNWIKIGTSFEKNGKQNVEIYCVPIKALKDGKLNFSIFDRKQNEPF